MRMRGVPGLAGLALSLIVTDAAPATAQFSGQRTRQRFDKATKGVSIDDFVKRLGSSDADTRLEAVKSLGNSREPKAIEYLIQAVGDPDLRVEAKAIGYLGDMRASEAIPVLVQYLSRTTTDANLKQLILAALGKIGDPRAAGPIADFLQRDLEPATRGTAVFALGEIGAAESTSTLRTIADKEAEDPNVRRLAEEALVKVESYQAAARREVKAPAQNFLQPKDQPPQQ